MTGSAGTLSGVPFTLLAGVLLSLGLFAVARFAKPKFAMFFVSLLAVQCVLNALLDLKTVFFLSSPFAPSVPSDAVNMANATGLPAVLWAIIWIGLALGILMVAMRFYVVRHDRLFEPDLAFPEFPVNDLPRTLSARSATATVGRSDKDPSA
jgi:hypothetical protein